MTSNDPATEAVTMLPGGFAARVLEPSPPAVTDEWFADDPPNAPMHHLTGIDHGGVNL